MLAAGFSHNIFLSAGNLNAAGNTLGGTVSGNGTISGGFTMGPGGVLSPGTSPGLIASDGNANLGLGSTYAEDLAGPNAVTGYDVLDVTGTLAINAILSLTLSYDPAPTDTFTIIRNDDVDPITGTFVGLPEGAVIVAANTNNANVYKFQITYQGNGISGPGNDVVLSVYVPEPGTMALAAMGVMGLMMRRRKR